MSLFDQVVGTLTGNQEGGNNALLEAALHMANDPKSGGLGGLVQSLQQGGLGDIVNSWVSNGQNLPASSEQLGAVLDSSVVQGLIEKLGLSREQVLSGLAVVLPLVIDRLTPNGEVPQSNDLMAQGLDLLKGKLFGA